MEKKQKVKVCIGLDESSTECRLQQTRRHESVIYLHSNVGMQ